jgi:hypothetical protein
VGTGAIPDRYIENRNGSDSRVLVTDTSVLFTDSSVPSKEQYDYQEWERAILLPNVSSQRLGRLV